MMYVATYVSAAQGKKQHSNKNVLNSFGHGSHASYMYSQENSDSEWPSLCAFTLHVRECIGHKPYPFVTSSLGLIATSLTTLLAPPPRGLAATPTFEVSGYTPVGDDERVSLCRVQLCHVPIGIISLGYLCTHR